MAASILPAIQTRTADARKYLANTKRTMAHYVDAEDPEFIVASALDFLIAQEKAAAWAMVETAISSRNTPPGQALRQAHDYMLEMLLQEPSRSMDNTRQCRSDARREWIIDAGKILGIG